MLRSLLFFLATASACGFDGSATLLATDSGAVTDSTAVDSSATPDANQNASCPAGYSYFGNHGYRYVTEAKTFDEAAFFCQGEGGHLVVLDSPEETTFVRGLGGGDPWVGLHDLVVEDDFQWVVGGDAQPDWSESEPSDSGSGEDCAILESDGELNDGTCDDNRPFICECDGRAPVAAPPCATSETYSEASNGRRYRRSTTDMSWVDAQASCVADGANLASIADDDENDVVDGLAGSGTAWIGLYESSDSDDFEWLVGDSSYRNFQIGWGDDESCAEILFSGGRWHDHVCDEAIGIGSLCECDPFSQPVTDVP